MIQFLAISLLIAAPAILAIWLARRDQFGLTWRRPPLSHIAPGGEEYPVTLQAEPPLRETINGAEVDDPARVIRMSES